MNRFKLLLSGLLISICSLQLFAQAQSPMLQPLPIDTNVRYGKLDNGLTYYVRHNALPKQRADFYIAQRVGSILEEDSQAGLAHFLEHMSFNGTKNFPGKNLINYLESVGVRFGANLNAYTSLDQTVYNISDAPTTRQGIVDSCMLILHDWSNNLQLDSKEIDDERGVIREEWRTRGGASQRILEKQLLEMFPGSQYANRLPIGSIDVINNFKHDELRRYYKKWYRPDLQGIIIVGDIDADKTVARLKEIFKDVPAPVNPAKRIYYPVPDNDKPIISLATDKEATSTNVYLFYKHDTIPAAVKASYAGLIMDYMRNVVYQMMSARLREIQQKPSSPFMAAAAYDDAFFVAQTKDAWSAFAQAKEGKIDETLAAITRETQRAKKFGFTASEYDRARADILSDIESQYKDRDKQKNSSYVSQYVNHFLTGGSISGIVNEYNFFNQVAPNISVDQVNQFVNRIIGDKDIVIAVSGPEKEGLKYPTKDELLDVYNKTCAENIEAYKETVSNEPLVKDLPAPGKIVSTKQNGKFGETEMTLSNGIKVYLKKTNFKDDEILMTASSPGGSTLFGNSDILNAKVLNQIVSLGGLGSFSRTDLSKKLAGKKASVSASVGSDNESLNGSTTPKDLETMFQLIYLNFTAPRADQDAYASFASRLKDQLKSYSLDPMSAFGDSLNYYLYNNNPRAKRIQMEDIDKINYARVLELYKERFANASDFAFTFVGNIDEAAIRPLLEKYLAVLPTLKRVDPEGNLANQPKFHKGVINNKFIREMQTPKASIVAIYSGTMDFSLKNVLSLQALKQILDIVYVAKVREEAGGTYGVSVSSQILDFPKGTTILQTYFDTDPAKAEQMNEIVRRELKNIAANGPKEEDFNKTKLNLEKSHSENIQENSYWTNVIDDYYFRHFDGNTTYDAVLKALTAKDVQIAAKALLSQGNCTEVFMKAPDKK